MHFHGVLRKPQLVRDLFVEQAVGKAQQHPKLLGRELCEFGGQFRIGLRAFRRHGWKRNAAVEHGLNRRRHVFGRGGFGDETRRTKLLSAPDHARVFVGGDHHHGDLRIFAAHVQQR